MKPPKRRRLHRALEIPGLPPSDPIEFSPAIVRAYPEDWHDILRLYYSDYRTRYRKIDDRKYAYVFRNDLDGSDEDLMKCLKEVYNHQKSAFKIQISITILLYNIKTDEYDVKVGNEVFMNLFPKPEIITSMAGLNALGEQIEGRDMVEVGGMAAPDTASRVLSILAHNVVCYKLGEKYPLLGARNGGRNDLPNWVKVSRSARCLPDVGGGDCIFQLLASHFANNSVKVKRATRDLKQKWCDEKRINIHKFDGHLGYDQLKEMEAIFHVAIDLYEAGKEKGDLTPVWLSLNARYDRVRGVVCNGGRHIGAIITNIRQLGKVFSCSDCGYIDKRKGNLKRHQKTCGDGKKHKDYGGNYLGRKRGLFQLMELEGLALRPDAKFYPFMGVFDCETYQAIKVDKVTQNKSYETLLRVLCIAVSSNVPSQELAYYSLDNCTNDYDMVFNLVVDLKKYARRANELMRDKLAYVFDQIDEKLVNLSKFRDRNRDRSVLEFMDSEIKKWNNYRRRLEEHCKMFPVYAYNLHFDLSLLKEHLVTIAGKLKMKFGTIIKTSGKTLVFTVGNLKFQDCMRLTSGGGLRDFLKSYGQADEQKLHYPHAWMTDPSLLSRRSLPEIEHWTDNLSGRAFDPKDYEEMQALWAKYACQTMADWLKIYCICDVRPLILALENQAKMWASFGVCQQTDGYSLPGLSMKAVMNEIAGTVGLIFWMPSDNSRDREIQGAIDTNIQGGISQVILRRAEVGRRIEGTNFTPGCLLGLDYTALYAWELSKPHFTGIPRLWYRKEDSILYSSTHLMARGCSMEELRFCLFKQWRKDQRYGKGAFEVEHRYNFGQMRFPGTSYSLDACIRKRKRGYLYQGCAYHPHRDCRRTNDHSRASIKEEVEKLEKQLDFYASIGWKVKVVRGCEFLDKILPKYPDFRKEVLQQYLEMPFRNRMTGSGILHRIKTGEFFGFITNATVWVPMELWKKFDLFPPIVSHRELTIWDLSPNIQEWINKMGIKFTKRRTLMTGFYGEGLTLCSDLVRFYLENGIEVHSFDKAVQFSPNAPFKDFVRRIGEKRAEADLDPNKFAMSNLYKLIGNSIYGKCIQDPKKWNAIKMIEKKDLERGIKNPHFKSYTPYGDMVEIVSANKDFSQKTPRLIGYKILNTSKLSLFKLYYDFILHCCGRTGVYPILCDTDSLYMALSGDSLENSVLDGRKRDSDRLKDEYLANESTKRTPGKTKVEWSGTKIVALSPKCNYGVAEDPTKNKFTLKGVRKNLNPMTYEHFVNILKTQGIQTAVNKGLELTADGWRAYLLVKKAMTYAYVKRALIGKTGERTICLDHFDDLIKSKISASCCRFSPY